MKTSPGIWYNMNFWLFKKSVWPLYGWGSTASGLQSHYREAGYLWVRVFQIVVRCGGNQKFCWGGYWVVGTWEGVILMMMKMMMNCFCGMVDWQKAFSLISIRDHCQRSSPSRISDMPRTGFEPVQNQASGLVEWSCAVAITTTPWRLTIQSF